MHHILRLVSNSICCIFEYLLRTYAKMVTLFIVILSKIFKLFCIIIFFEQVQQRLYFIF